jgi:hemoglobin
LSKQPFVPASGPPRSEGPNKEIYAAMGEEGIFSMMRDFYAELEDSTIRHMFPEDMETASKRSAAFFVGLLGGPPLYQQQFGNPMMRARHLPFAIDEQARKVWLDCFDRVLTDSNEKYRFPQNHLADFRRFLAEFSAWMVNTR